MKLENSLKIFISLFFIYVIPVYGQKVILNVDYLNISLNKKNIRELYNNYVGVSINRLSGYRVGVCYNAGLNSKNHLQIGIAHALRLTELDIEYSNSWPSSYDLTQRTKLKTFEIPLLFRRDLIVKKSLNIFMDAGVNSCFILKAIEYYNYTGAFVPQKMITESSFGWKHFDFSGQFNLGLSMKKYGLNLGYNRTLKSGSGKIILPQNFFRMGFSYLIFESVTKTKELKLRRLKEIKNY